jgi:hypothetical protein
MENICKDKEMIADEMLCEIICEAIKISMINIFVNMSWNLGIVPEYYKEEDLVKMFIDIMKEDEDGRNGMLQKKL